MEKKHSRFREQHKSRPVGGKEHEVLLREVRRQMELEYSEREREGCKVKLDNKLVVFEPRLGIYFQSNFSGKPFENLASIVHFYIGLMKGAGKYKMED